MKLVDVNEFYAEQGGGVRTYVNQKLEAGAALGHQVVVIAPGPQDRKEARAGGHVIWVRSRPMPLDPRYYLLLRERAVHEVIEREQPDVIEGSSAWTGGLYAGRYRGRGLKSFVFHQDPVAVYAQTALGARLGERRVDRAFGWYWRYLRSLSGRYDLTMTSGAWLAERLRSFGIDNAVAVPFGIDKALFSPHRASRELRRELLAGCGLGEDAALLLTVSRHHPEKRIPTLIDAVARLSARPGGRPVGLVIYGDGPYRFRVERKASRVPSVRLGGFVREREQMANILASADALLHGSAAETYGIAVAEALCSGLPAVVPSAGGARDLVCDSCAELYPPGDSEACAAAIERLLSRDPVALRSAALEAAGGLATSSQHFERLFECYGQRLERP